MNPALGDTIMIPTIVSCDIDECNVYVSLSFVILLLPEMC